MGLCFLVMLSYYNKFAKSSKYKTIFPLSPMPKFVVAVGGCCFYSHCSISHIIGIWSLIFIHLSNCPISNFIILSVNF